MNDLITIANAARARGVTIRSVAHALSSGALTVEVVAGRRFVVMDELYAAWLERSPGRAVFDSDAGRRAVEARWRRGGVERPGTSVDVPPDS